MISLEVATEAGHLGSPNCCPLDHRCLWSMAAGPVVMRYWARSRSVRLSQNESSHFSILLSLARGVTRGHIDPRQHSPWLSQCFLGRRLTVKEGVLYAPISPPPPPPPVQCMLPRPSSVVLVRLDASRPVRSSITRWHFLRLTYVTNSALR